MKITTNEWERTLRPSRWTISRRPLMVNSGKGDTDIPTVHQQAMSLLHHLPLFPTGIRFQKGLSGHPEKGWKRKELSSLGMFSPRCNRSHVFWCNFWLRKANQDLHCFITLKQQAQAANSRDVLGSSVARQEKPKVFSVPYLFMAFWSLQRNWKWLPKMASQIAGLTRAKISAGIRSSEHPLCSFLTRNFPVSRAMVFLAARTGQVLPWYDSTFHGYKPSWWWYDHLLGSNSSTPWTFLSHILKVNTKARKVFLQTWSLPFILIN